MHEAYTTCSSYTMLLQSALSRRFPSNTDASEDMYILILLYAVTKHNYVNTNKNFLCCNAVHNKIVIKV